MIESMHQWIWGPGMLVLFLVTGVIYTGKTRGFAILGIRTWWSTTVGSMGRTKEDKKDSRVSSFQAACTALAATIGTGNIAGVATAVMAGGPGAVFWMWVSAALGMSTAYAETELGIRYRRKSREGSWISGAMVYLEHGIGCRWLAVIYACLCLLASFGMGSMVQANAISETMSFACSVPSVLTGALLTVLVWKILSGGVRVIAKTAETMVPLSAAVYLLASGAVLVLFRDRIPGVLMAIVRDAFAFDSAAGGVLGVSVNKAMRFGIARGVFSNEAGLGSMAALNGGADQADPSVQGQWAIFEVFFDTIVCCTLTALVILCAAGEELAGFQESGAALTGYCFSKALGYPGGYTVSVCVVLFAFATIIAWYYMGKQAAAYLGETLGISIESLYFAGYLICVALGCLGPMEKVWGISDVFNGMMAIPNLAALILLVPQVDCPKKGMKKST